MDTFEKLSTRATEYQQSEVIDGLEWEKYCFEQISPRYASFMIAFNSSIILLMGGIGGKNFLCEEFLVDVDDDGVVEFSDGLFGNLWNSPDGIANMN